MPCFAATESPKVAIRWLVSVGISWCGNTSAEQFGSFSIAKIDDRPFGEDGSAILTAKCSS
jgi:hypothetical protein